MYNNIKRKGGFIMKYENKYSLTREENRRFAKANLTNLVFVSARLEGVNTTLVQTQTIINGLGVDNVSLDDINVIVQLKRGWDYVIQQDNPLDLNMEKEINKIVARDSSVFPGYLRNGSGLVTTYRGDYVPPEIDEEKENKNLTSILSNKNTTATDKALTLMYYNMKQQMFYDGNKRTAILAANKIMIDNGCGLINVPLEKWSTWMTKIADFYLSKSKDSMEKLKEWTYANGINGMEPNLEARKERATPVITQAEQEENIKDFKKLRAEILNGNFSHAVSLESRNDLER